ncbi:MAG: D-2-hydroxyacid dehydrogenase [Proteobacteria bacterium]|nr:D-2-hydroxyacid dehydrogenase [Pseudomonadota bacterium]
MTSKAARPAHIVFITSPLEAEHVATMQRTARDRAEIIHEADLLPPTRYIADHKGRDGFRLSPEQSLRWRAHLGRATILWDFPSGPPAAGGGLAWAPKVKWVQTTSSGVGQMVQRLGLAESDLIVTTARGVHAEPLAEFVFLALLAHAKDLPMLQRDQRRHRWERYCGGELRDKRLAIIGAGKVGAEVGRIGRAFGMQVAALVNNPRPGRETELHAHEMHGPSQLHRVLGQADYVVLTLPHTPSSERMIDAEAIARMKPGAVLVNIARGQVIDEDALIRALRSGQIAYAALDVAATEPLPADSPLWDMPNVLISPHSASTAPSENRKITEIFCHNLGCYLEGRVKDMLNVLDKKRLY